MDKIVSRAYNRFESLPSGYIKKISSTQRFADEMNYYFLIGSASPTISKVYKIIGKYFPRVIETDMNSDEKYMIMERYNSSNLGSYIRSDLERPFKTDWDYIFKQLSDILYDFSTITPMFASIGSDEAAQRMYVDKTELEFLKFTNNRFDLKELFDEPMVYINDVEYTNFPLLWPMMKHYIKKELFNFKMTAIHGDLCFSNILYNDYIMRLIDPRGSFGSVGIYGDPRYDIAKLYHSVDGGYEFFINDQFILHSNDFKYTLIFNDAQEKDKALTVFENIILSKYNKRHIKMIQGLIYIGMCDRHYDSPKRQLAMYLTGVRLLNEALEL